jgi:phosphoglycolate phosphatase-like HAD superfamily hydrolase
MIVAFDFDGTLAQSFDLCDECFFEACKFGGKNLKKEDIRDLFGPTEEGIIKKIFGDEAYKPIFDYYLKIYAQKHQELLPKLTPGALTTLKYLKSHNITMVFLSGRSLKTWEYTKKFFSLYGYFAKEYLGSLDGVNKPDNLKQVMKDFNVKKEDIFYIGDSLQDIKSCASVGVTILSLVYRNAKKYKYFETINPNNVYTNYGAILKRLKLEIAKRK